MFSWDETKNEANQRKHGISFEAAQLVFDDPLHVSRQDRIEGGEERWQTIGMAGEVVLILVAHTWRDSDSDSDSDSDGDSDGEQIRIISARRATKLASGYFWPHIRSTAIEVLLGLSVGCCVGFASGVAMAESSLLRGVLMPYIVTSQVIPKLALMPLFIVWFGFGITSTVVITALICFFPLLESTLTGLQQVEPQRIELFRVLGATRLQTLWRLKLPSGLPVILAGLRVAVVLALVGAVVGEFIGANRGLGALIIASQGMMDTSLMFAVLLIIAALGMLLYQTTLAIEKRLLKPYTIGSWTKDS